MKEQIGVLESEIFPLSQKLVRAAAAEGKIGDDDRVAQQDLTVTWFPTLSMAKSDSSGLDHYVANQIFVRS